MKKQTLITVILILVFIVKGYGQTPIPISGTVVTTNAINNVERNFSGFNNGEGHIDGIFWKESSIANLTTSPNFYTVFSNNLGSNIYYRFPGGMIANDYNRWKAGYGKNGTIGTSFFPGDQRKYIQPLLSDASRDLIYGSMTPTTLCPNCPWNYYSLGPANAKSNMIFPFINTVTQNKNNTVNCVFDVNILNHYRNYPAGTADLISYPAVNTKQELFTVDSIKVKDINNLNDFNTSTLSPAFKNVVNQNLDAFKTLVENNIYVDKVEFGNELFNCCPSPNTPMVFTDFGIDFQTFVTNIQIEKYGIQKQMIIVTLDL